jgi:excinuclease ABC subunit A
VGKVKEDLQQFNSKKHYSGETSITLIEVKNAYANNLKNVSVSFPAQAMTVITGNSGSGKTSLLEYVINSSLDSRKPIFCKEIIIHSEFSQHIFISQEIASASALSIPATKLDIFEYIRNIFAQEPQSKQKGLKQSHYSFHTHDGQCPDCQGRGIQKTAMDFWSDSEIACESCKGERYAPKSLEVKINGLNIAEVLNLSFTEFTNWLSFIPQNKIPTNVKNILALTEKTGIGYISLGQQFDTLSSGEMQRIKLVSGMRLANSNCLYLLDEPTSGLHPSDTAKLLKLFNELLENGSTIICATHDEMVINAAGKVGKL